MSSLLVHRSHLPVLSLVLSRNSRSGCSLYRSWCFSPLHLLDCNEAICGGDHYLFSTWRNQNDFPPPKFCPPIDVALIPDLKWVDFIGKSHSLLC